MFSRISLTVLPVFFCFLCGCDLRPLGSLISGGRIGDNFGGTPFGPVNGNSAFTNNFNGFGATNASGQTVSGAVQNSGNFAGNSFNGSNPSQGFVPIGQLTLFAPSGFTFFNSARTPNLAGFGRPGTIDTNFRGSNANSFLPPTAPSAVGFPF